jgi:hypothetical protein
MMDAISTFETSANVYQTTRRNIPKDSHLHQETLFLRDETPPVFTKRYLKQNRS